MLGLLGTLIFGVTYTGTWINENLKEEKRYKIAKENRSKLYVDKHNSLRCTNTRKRYNSDNSREEIKTSIERRIKSKYEAYYNYMIEENDHRISRHMDTKKILSFEEWYLEKYGEQWNYNNL